MRTFKAIIAKRKISIIIAFAFAVVAAIVRGLLLLFPETGIYSGIVKEISAFLAFVFSGINISVSEIILLSISIILIVSVTRAIYLLYRRKIERFINFVTSLACTVLIAVSVFFMMYGYIYVDTSPLFADYEAREYTYAEFLYSCEIIYREANRLSEQVTRQEETLEYKTQVLNHVSQTVSEALSAVDYLPAFGVPNAKPFSLPNVWYSMGIDGMYFPFTGEANTQLDNGISVIPYRAAHELSHRLSIGREDEANFAAFMLLQDGTIIERYSAFSQVWVLMGNELANVNFLLYCQYVGQMTTSMNDDLGYQSRRAEEISGAITESIGTELNDSYLRAVGQSEGVVSYTRVVAFIVNWVLTEYPMP